MEDFLGFRFGGTHTDDLNLKIVSSSDYYTNRTLPNFSDQTEQVPGGDGTYYFGSSYDKNEFSCSFAFDEISEENLRKIRQVFGNDKLQDLIFDEEPYKHWRAKISKSPEIKYVCFMDKTTGQRVYKGEGSINFICYFPYAFCYEKYVVLAADYYMLHPPECLLPKNKDYNYFVNPSEDNIFFPLLPEDTKYHYNLNPNNYIDGTKIPRDIPHQNLGGRNWTPNDKKPWYGGYPTIEQVQAGELYYDTPEGIKNIINARGYWDNVPEWEGTAKLLTTPTLDYERELMYMPQYSKVEFINTDIGYNQYRSMIGTRILVYNPGDLPIDWEIKFNENKKSFWSCRAGEKFRIRRFNVERLSIPEAVDWCGLTTYIPSDDEPFKYGNLYFKRRVFNKKKLIENIEKYEEEIEIYKPDGSTLYSKEEIIEQLNKKNMVCDKHWNDEDRDMNYQYEDWSIQINSREYQENRNSEDWTIPLKTAFNLHLNDYPELFEGVITYENLGEVHPRHCYYAEPIPRQQLGDFIKLFYWQTIQWRGEKTVTGDWTGIYLWKDMMPDDFWIDSSLKDQIKDMSHPLVNFIRMFNIINEDGTLGDPVFTYREKMKDLNYEQGIILANQYELLRGKAISEKEEFNLYWKFLRKLLFNFYPMLEGIEDNLPTTGRNGQAYSIEDFIYDFINMPAEYISSDTRDLDYDNYVFNAFKMPEWITSDYIEINQSNLSGASLIKEYMSAIGLDESYIFTGHIIYYDSAKLDGINEYSTLQKQLNNLIGDGGCLNDLLDDYYYCNSESRMLYTTENPLGMEFTYAPNKNIQNDAIEKGHWFKLPPGWSLLEIEPVIDESTFGGKRWLDSRPYYWGYGGDLYNHERESQQLFDMTHDMARVFFFQSYMTPDEIINHSVSENDILLRTEITDANMNRKAVGGTIGDYQYTEDLSKLTYSDVWYGTEDNLDELIKFRIWYNKHLKAYPIEYNYFEYCLYKKQQNNAEYFFLKKCDEIWQSISHYYEWTSLKGTYFDPDTGEKPSLKDFDVMGYPLRCINGMVSDWWWYACNYLWTNFPPIYWGYADMLNDLNIKYTPLFY